MIIQSDMTNDMRTATILDVAELAGVSAATVSRAFNNPRLVRPSTRARVMDAAERLNFVANAWASSLSSKVTKMIGVLIPTINYSIYSDTVAAIQTAADQQGYTLVVSSSEWSEEIEAKRIHKFIEQRVDGLVLIGAERSHDLYEKMRTHNIPFVIIWKLASNAGLPSVSFDNHKASAIVVDHFVALGHKRIALIHGSDSISDRGLGRREGFEQRMEQLGLPVDPGFIQESYLEFEDAQAAMRRLMEAKNPPTAVLAANDVLAIGAMKACQELGLTVPGDISIAGCDNMSFGQYTTPPLTTVKTPVQEMGSRAVREIIKAAGTQITAHAVELPLELLLRGSTGPVPVGDAQ
jgi:LacI family transcriptional regulator, galactose operon repressor